MREPCYLGIDGSLNSLGLCAVPASWDGDYSRIRRETLGVTLPKAPTQRQLIQRMLDLSRDVRRFAIQCGVTVAVIEDVPTHNAWSIKPLSELRGFIRSELARECGLYAEPVNQSRARKLFLGKLPDKNRKEATIAAVDCLTDAFMTGDEKDAFVTVNWRMAQDVGVHVIAPPAPEPVKKQRAKRAA